jgi:YfiH family protein
MGRLRTLITERADHGVSEGAWARCNLGGATGDEPAAVRRNRELATAACGLERVHIVRQVHGVDVIDAEGAGVPAWDAEPAGDVLVDAALPPADAVLTRATGAGVGVVVADCVSIALASSTAVVVVHAGWRGLLDGVIERAAESLRAASGSDSAGRFVAVLGPCIGPCCFEVGEDVAARFDARHVQHRSGAPRPFVDLRAAATARLAALGVPSDADDRCTACTAELFSYRRDGGVTGRHALVAWLD